MSILKHPLWPPSSDSQAVDVVGLGEISVDHLCVVGEWPTPGQKMALLRSEQRPGGQVASALLGCVRLGLRAAYIGSVGLDSAAEIALGPLAEAGLDLAGVRRKAGARTRTATILVRSIDGERTVLEDRDPRLNLARGSLEAAEIERGRLIHLDASDPDAASWAAQTARRAGRPVSLDADAVWPGAEKLLSEVDFPVVSRRFAEEWGGAGTFRDGLNRLARAGARLAVVTCGDQGAWAQSGCEIFHVPAYAIEPADTTGAGDAFHAGFIWAVLQGKTGEVALRHAHAVAALSCGALGAQEGLPRRDELDRFLAQPPGLREVSAAESP